MSEWELFCSYIHDIKNCITNVMVWYKGSRNSMQWKQWEKVTVRWICWLAAELHIFILLWQKISSVSAWLSRECIFPWEKCLWASRKRFCSPTPNPGLGNSRCLQVICSSLECTRDPPLPVRRNTEKSTGLFCLSLVFTVYASHKIGDTKEAGRCN